jgi:hypothetical protein
MLKKTSMVIICALFALFSCGGPAQLIRNDITTLQDKNFYLTKVSVDAFADNPLFGKDPAFHNPDLLKFYFFTLPVQAIAETLSEQLDITIDTSDFKKTAKNIEKPEWTSDKKNVNSITIGSSIVKNYLNGYGTGLKFYNKITLTLINGKTKSFYLPVPEETNIYFNIQANEDEDVTRIIKKTADTELKLLPKRLADMIKKEGF